MKYVLLNVFALYARNINNKIILHAYIFYFINARNYSRKVIWFSYLKFNSIYEVITLGTNYKVDQHLYMIYYLLYECKISNKYLNFFMSL